VSYVAAPGRYDSLPYRTCGRSGLRLPEITLGLWHNFGDATPLETQRAMLRTAFDLGITHFDLANNYGPPFGSTESNFGTHMRRDFRPYRDELLISSKAGWDMWPGPYGQGLARTASFFVLPRPPIPAGPPAGHGVATVHSREVSRFGMKFCGFTLNFRRKESGYAMMHGCWKVFLKIRSRHGSRVGRGCFGLPWDANHGPFR